LNFISQQLKQAREEKHLSLNDIAALTRINRRFLEAIEEGNFGTVPQAYLRSFIRAYAQTVELDTDKLFHSTEKGNTENISDSETYEQTNERDSEPIEEVAAVIAEQTGEDFKTRRKKLQRQDVWKGIVLFALLMGVVFVVSKFSANNSSKKVEEIPFDEVVKENEIVAARKDSLRLSAIANDSVWLIVRLDGKQTSKVTLAKNGKATFSAKKKFSITASDAGKIQFSLNNHFIGTLGKNGSILRNSILDKEILNRFDTKGNVGTLKEEKEDSSAAN